MSSVKEVDATAILVKNVIVLDSEGKRIVVKYFSSEWCNAAMDSVIHYDVATGLMWQTKQNMKSCCLTRQADSTPVEKVGCVCEMMLTAVFSGDYFV